MANDILLTSRNGVRLIKLNRPLKKNALTRDMYLTLAHVLNTDSQDNNIVTTIITGIGDYFSSGNDFKDSLKYSAENKFSPVKDTVKSFINYPKLLIAVVNGPAIGFGATMVALCDIVYVSDRAIFDAPFVRLGLCAEAGSSFTFPFSLGRSKASEVLFLNHKLNAQEAYQFGFVSKIISHNNLDSFIESLYKYGSLSPESIRANKKLIMANFKEILNECNEREIEQLNESVKTKEFTEAVMKFLNRKSKL